MNGLPVVLAAFAAGALVAFLVTYFWARSRQAAAMSREAVTRSQLENAQKLAADQQGFVEASRRDLENAFKALAAQALDGTTKQFLELAATRLGQARSEATADLDARRTAIEEMLKPLRETLGKLETRTGELEMKREGAYATLMQQVKGLSELTSTLQTQTTSLATALRGSQVRGRWGEIALRNVAELAGMTEHCDFEEQETVSSGGRPDMTVRLPGGRFIAVDSKVPLSAYLEAAEATDEAARGAALDRHVAALKAHVKALAGREYARELKGDVDLVVLFLPGDPFLSAAFSRSPDLQVEALRSKVLLATPTTLVALLRTVAIYWQQRALAENAELIASAARELYERTAVFAEHLGKVGRGLGTAVDAYNSAVGSFEKRVVPAGEKLKELKAVEGAKKEIGGVEILDEQVRRLEAGRE
jgi:DNA recombination protein RmuC